MPIAIGDTLPEATFREATSEGSREVTTSELFKGRKVVLFGVPGAFTPTCSLNHLPGFLEKRDAILQKGVDDIAVIAVNDAYVMDAWAKATGAEGKIRFLSDWDCGFTKAIGLENDLSDRALGLRSERYSMIVEDGKVTALNVEEKPGRAIGSGAEALLDQL